MQENNEIHFIVYGDPRPKQRPRFRRIGKFTTTYTPKETVEYENKVRKAFNEAAGKCEFTKLEGPVEVEAECVFRIPKSVSKKKHAELLGTPALKKPDTDNVIKSVLDPLNDLAYNDDSQVCKLTGKKSYGDEPRVEITIRECKDNKIWPKSEVIEPFIFVEEN